MTQFATKVLGLKDLAPPALNLKAVFDEDTLATEPVLLIISPGTDPSHELAELSNSVVGSENYFQVSMGQGQMEVAVQYLRQCASQGSWLCLKNLHLVTHWLPTLVKELLSIQPNPKFRLWLTSESHAKFSPALLQMCLKITFEAPPGIKRNLLRTYESWSNTFSDMNVVQAQSLFSLAWFHAVVQERRTYIPQGWTKFYEFTQGDLRAGTEVIDHLFQKSGVSIQWEFIHGLFESAIYGGRVDNVFDMRVLSSYVHQYFNDKVIGTSNRRPITENITIPATKDYKEYVQFIRRLPDEDRPYYFGLPVNMEQSAQRTWSGQVVSQLKILLRPAQVDNIFDVERWNTELSPTLNLWKKLNQGSQLLQMRLSVPLEDSGNPVQAFVSLEHFQGVQLVQRIHSSLATLSKVIRGTRLLTREIHQLAAALLNHQTPDVWQKAWDGPEDPLMYLRSVVGRASALQTWLQKSQAGTLLQQELDLSDLLHPDTFINVLRQQTARQVRQSMDNLRLESSWSQHGQGRSKGAHKDSVLISGLQLEGCIFDGQQLVPCEHDSPSVSSVPPCALTWVPKESKSSYPSGIEIMSLPVYFTPTRERIVLCLDVPCGGDPDFWLQSGAAIFLRST